MANVHGDISGLKKNIVDRLEKLYDIVVPFGEIITMELSVMLLQLSEEINKEIAVYIHRRGKITAVAVGDVKTVTLPDFEGRRAETRLSGIRCIHTHPGGNSLLSAPDLSALKEMRYDVMVALSGVNEDVEASLGFLSMAVGDGKPSFETIGPIPLKELLEINFSGLVLEIERTVRWNGQGTKLAARQEAALLVGVERQSERDVEDSLKELAQLAETAGASVLKSVYQKKEKPDPAFFIGRGKLEEVRLLRQELEADIVIFDDELSPAQQRNIEQFLSVKVVDRTALILDIFAQRARSHEGKLQVELAQLRYSLPRLSGQGLVLSRLGGGIGTRGPGETKLEVDRRRIRSRITDIEKDIANIKKHRSLQRDRRQQSNIPTIALVGYTNAGKSTLLNHLTDAGVLAEDKLFATLDPTTRRMELPSGRAALVTDTVGFIQKLPHQLIAAFRATFEEVVEADLLLHVLDISNPGFQEQSDAVFQVLKEFEADEKPLITVYNKVDKLSDTYLLERCLQDVPSVAISAATGQGIDDLKSTIDQYFAKQVEELKLLIPYGESGLLSKLYDDGIVHSIEYLETGISVHASLNAGAINRYIQYRIRNGELTDE